MNVNERDRIVTLVQELVSKLDELVKLQAQSSHIRCFWCHGAENCEVTHQKFLGEHTHPYVHSACYALRAQLSNFLLM